MYQINEVMTLVFWIIGFLLFAFLYHKKAIPPYPLLFTGFFCILASNAFTIIEGFIFYEAFNLLEHVAYFAAACFFLEMAGHGAGAAAGSRLLELGRCDRRRRRRRAGHRRAPGRQRHPQEFRHRRQRIADR